PAQLKRTARRANRGPQPGPAIRPRSYARETPRRKSGLDAGRRRRPRKHGRALCRSREPTELSGAGYRRGDPRRQTSRRSHCEQAHGRHPFSARLARSTRGARICLTGSVRCHRLGSRRATASVLAATQSETAVPPKTDFETWAPKTAENARQNVSVVRLTNSAPASLGKEARIRPEGRQIRM